MRYFQSNLQLNMLLQSHRKLQREFRKYCEEVRTAHLQLVATERIIFSPN